ncbi:hypothetical protein [Streptomyces chattanoogensis]|uniref:hypothetical protein n=1 Tax=Streptomyces chattanoogensis TaxID=66876 RepID=UPI00367F0A3E
MSTVDGGVRIGRSYTRARRMPWVMGRIGDWTLPFGPYTPAQICVAFTGAFALIKTFAWWRMLGPAPVVALGFAVWAVRRARIGGRTPFNCALGLGAYLAQPRGGRINGRPVRDGRHRVLHGGCALEEAPLVGVAHPADAAQLTVRRSVQPGSRGRRPVVRRPRLPRWDRHKPVAVPAPRPAPTAMQQMLRRRDDVGGVQSDGGGS